MHLDKSWGKIMSAKSIGISGLVVFGDSLSDNGKLLKVYHDVFEFNVQQKLTEPAWEGRFSNGPTYAEQLAQFFSVNLKDRAFIGAEASTESPTLLIDPTTNQPLSLPIDLSNQVQKYVHHLGGSSPPIGTTALINIGSNDYLAYLIYGLYNTESISDYVTKVVGSIEQAIHKLTCAGIKQIIVFTLPDLGTTPFLQGMDNPAAVALAHALSEANNRALTDMVQGFSNVQLVDIYQLSRALFSDPRGFGFTDQLLTTWVEGGSSQFAPNGVIFFNDVHPTTAAHGVSAAFAKAVLTSDHVEFLDGTQTVINAERGNNFIFATPIDRTNSGLTDDYTINGGPGADVIFAGSGKVTVYGGSGGVSSQPALAALPLKGGPGPMCLRQIPTGQNSLDGGRSDDALVANRGGTNTLIGGPGNDLFILKEGGDSLKEGGDFNFGNQVINGGPGHDTLRFIINDQNPSIEKLLVSEFMKVKSAWANNNFAGGFEIDGLHVEGIERIELQVELSIKRYQNALFDNPPDCSIGRPNSTRPYYFE